MPEHGHIHAHEGASPESPSVSIPPDDVLDFVFEVTAIADSVEFESSGRGHPPGTWLTVADCANPDNAGNNCFAVTCEVHEAAYTQIGVTDRWQHERVEIWTENPDNPTNSGVHWANVMTCQDTGEQWVIDYTARQFDPDAPFPLVASFAEWQQQTSALILGKFGGEVKSVTIH